MSLDKDLQDEILRSISTEGAASEENKAINVVLGSRSNVSSIVNTSSGLPRIKPNILPSFKLILGQPLALAGLSPLQVRCCLCSRVISYPSWHYVVRYSVNHFHYFVCFDPSTNNQPTTRCFRP